MSPGTAITVHPWSRAARAVMSEPPVTPDSTTTTTPARPAITRFRAGNRHGSGRVPGGYGCGDNTPPDVRVSHVVREWNSKWAYPRLIVATNSIFFEKLEKQCQDVRTFRGELPHTDYVVGAASTAAETAINRITHDQLHAAEKFATIASALAGAPYPAESIREAYDDVLLYDEHTWGMAHQVGRTQDFDWADEVTAIDVRSCFNAWIIWI